MSNAARLAEILKKLGDAHYQAADELLALGGDQVVASRPAAQPVVAEGSETICPAHKTAYIEGKFGLMCPSKGTNPAWTNPRGYCSINPKNVAAYLRTQAAA